MADVKISQLPLAGTLVPASDALPIVNGGNTTQTTPASVTTAALNATPVTIAQGGTNATTASAARTNLGLGVMATQAASNVAITGGTISGVTDLGASNATITGGSINGTTIGNGTPAAGTFSSVSSTGQLISTKTGTTTPGGGQLYLNGATSNRIDYSAVGVAAPTYVTKSAGTKVTFFPATGAAAVDYAAGVEAGALWHSIPGNDAGQFHKWYGGTVQVASLSGTGVFKLIGDILPTTDNIQNLGSALLRWNSVHIGPGSLFLQDTNNAGLNAEITVTDGVLLVNGAPSFQVGNIRITDPTPGNPTIAAINGDPLYIFGDSVTIEDDAGGGRLTCSSEGVAINSDATNVTVSNGKVTIAGMTVPAHSYGSLGDQAGMVAFDATYMYYCTAQYRNTSTNIWKRIAWDTRTW
jgi:hypothetical protein